MVMLALSTLRIIDGCQGKADAPVVKSMAFQLTTEEARTAPDVVTSMYLYHLFYCFLVYAYVLSNHIYGLS